MIFDIIYMYLSGFDIHKIKVLFVLMDILYIIISNWHNHSISVCTWNLILTGQFRYINYHIFYINFCLIMHACSIIVIHLSCLPANHLLCVTHWMYLTHVYQYLKILWNCHCPCLQSYFYARSHNVNIFVWS